MLALASAANANPLPPLPAGTVVAGPGRFVQDTPLRIEGHITLKKMDLEIHGPITLAEGATLELEDVRLQVHDPVGSPNGTSGLRTEGAAHVVVRRSFMDPVGAAHPMWRMSGTVDVESFKTTNSEFHLDHADAHLNNLQIFELDVSQSSQVVSSGLDLVFLSTHSSENDNLVFDGIPNGRNFSRSLKLGSGSTANLQNARMQMFLLYVHGATQAAVSHMANVQLAIFPDCSGTLSLPAGRSAPSAATIVPAAGASTCPFQIKLLDVDVNTWDVYAKGNADLLLHDSVIDELVAREHAKVRVKASEVYADWMNVSDQASIAVVGSRVGALRLAKQRPDLATSQVRVTGDGRATFDDVDFDCGIVARDRAQVAITRQRSAPAYVHLSGDAVVLNDGAPLEGKAP